MAIEGLAQFIGHIGAVAEEAKKLDTTVVTGIAIEAKAIVLSVAGSEIPGRRMSRFGKNGVTLNAQFIVKPGTNPSAILLPTPPGPWYLLEGGGKEHSIGIRSKRRGGPRGGAGFLGNAALGFAAVGPVDHPAFAAKHTWSKASAAAIEAGDKTFGHVTRQAYLKMFAG